MHKTLQACLTPQPGRRQKHSLGPILGPTATGAVGLVALSINLVVPAAVVLLEVDAAKQRYEQLAIAQYSLSDIIAAALIEAG